MSESKKIHLLRPDYEATDSLGIPFIRKANLIGELPDLAARASALQEATATLAKILGLTAKATVKFGTPVFCAFDLNRNFAKRHQHSVLLLKQGGELPLDLCESYLPEPKSF